MAMTLSKLTLLLWRGADRQQLTLQMTLQLALAETDAHVRNQPR